jgi:hypothetical protein
VDEVDDEDEDDEDELVDDVAGFELACGWSSGIYTRTS